MRASILFRRYLLTQALLLCLVTPPALVLAQDTQRRPEPPRTTVAGYMDLHFNKAEFDDGRID